MWVKKQFRNKMVILAAPKTPAKMKFQFTGVMLIYLYTYEAAFILC